MWRTCGKASFRQIGKIPSGPGVLNDSKPCTAHSIFWSVTNSLIICESDRVMLESGGSGKWNDFIGRWPSKCVSSRAVMVSLGFVVGRPLAFLTHSTELSLFLQRIFWILEVVLMLLLSEQKVCHDSFLALLIWRISQVVLCVVESATPFQS